MKFLLLLPTFFVFVSCAPAKHGQSIANYQGSEIATSGETYTDDIKYSNRGSRTGSTVYYVEGERQRNSKNHKEQKNQLDRQIVYSAFLLLEVANPDTASARLASIAQTYNGYVSESGSQRIVIRVDAKHLIDALKEIEYAGKVRSKNIRGNDITDQFSDHEIRLANAIQARDRYLELLAQAENVEAALKVEIELERLNEVIDRLKGQLNRMEHLLTYSTITITVKEKVKPGILGYIGIGLYRSVRWLFVRN